MKQGTGNTQQVFWILLIGWIFQFINSTFFQIENLFKVPASSSPEMNSTTVMSLLLIMLITIKNILFWLQSIDTLAIYLSIHLCMFI